MSWQPFQVVATRGQAIEAALWLRDHLAGIPEPDKPVIPKVTRERVLRPQLERLLENWNITEEELGPVQERGPQEISKDRKGDSSMTKKWEDLELVLTTRQAAEVLQVHTKTVEALCRTGKLSAKKVGKAWRIRRDDLWTYLNSTPSDVKEGDQ